MCAGYDVMVMYARREVEAATGEHVRETKNFIHVTIPSGVREIDHLAFELCENVLTMTIPESVTTIHQEAFIQCYNLRRITLPESLTIIGHGVFSECASLESVAVPESVEFIGCHAFSGCKSLEKITIAVHWQESLFLPRLVLSEQLPFRTACRWRTSQSVDRWLAFQEIYFQRMWWARQRANTCLGDGHWTGCLWRLLLFGKGHHTRVCDSHWERFLQRLSKFDRNYHTSQGANHWSRCLYWL